MKNHATSVIFQKFNIININLRHLNGNKNIHAFPLKYMKISYTNSYINLHILYLLR